MATARNEYNEIAGCRTWRAGRAFRQRFLKTDMRSSCGRCHGKAHNDPELGHADRRPTQNAIIDNQISCLGQNSVGVAHHFDSSGLVTTSSSKQIINMAGTGFVQKPIIINPENNLCHPDRWMKMDELARAKQSKKIHDSVVGKMPC